MWYLSHHHHPNSVSQVMSPTLYLTFGYVIYKWIHSKLVTVLPNMPIARHPLCPLLCGESCETGLWGQVSIIKEKNSILLIFLVMLHCNVFLEASKNYLFHIFISKTLTWSCSSLQCRIEWEFGQQWYFIQNWCAVSFLCKQQDHSSIPGILSA